MSYFAAGYRTKPGTINEFQQSFSAVVPAPIAGNCLRVDHEETFLLSYGFEKVISDVYYHSARSGSWFAVIGTPLVALPDDRKREQFLERLLGSPEETISNRIDGSFAVLAFDAATDSFMVAADYNNTIPIYVTETACGTLISSHELQLARALRPPLDPIGFSMAVQLGVCWGSRTRFSGIRRLLPCEVVVFNPRRETNSRFYWHPAQESQWVGCFDDAIEKMLSLLRESVQSYFSMSSAPSVICDFTAGEDARLLLSQCHALRIPFKAQVTGLESDIDVRVARIAQGAVGFHLEVQPRSLIRPEQVAEAATLISIMNEAYQDYIKSCVEYATEMPRVASDYQSVKFCGAPGGEAFRGAYYLRGKALSPSRMRDDFDLGFFLRMKFLLDFQQGLFRLSDRVFLETVMKMATDAIEEVKHFPVGIMIDHLLRVFQTCNTGLMYKNPRYLPLASSRMTRAVYGIPPRFKRGGRLTKACTEILFPELAVIRTQKGVPTIRKTPARMLRFLPEYYSVAASILSGTLSRLLKWRKSNKPYFSWEVGEAAIHTLLSENPYRSWFSSADSMATGYMYDAKSLNHLLDDLRAGSRTRIPILARVMNQELACRWVLGQDAR